MKFFLKERGMRADLEYGELNVSGNELYGFRPFQLMVASIVGCSGSVFMKILEKQRIELDDLIITADVERNELEANKIEKISLHYVIKGKRLDPDKMERNLHLSRKNCSMVRSIEDSIDVIETFEIINLDD